MQQEQERLLLEQQRLAEEERARERELQKVISLGTYHSRQSTEITLSFLDPYFF